MSAASHGPPMVDPWLWTATFGETLLAGLDPTGAGRRQRQRRLVALWQAAQRSPLYSERFGRSRAASPADLAALPPVDKPELMQRFDAWSTDRRVTREAVERFLQDSGQVGEAFLDRYLIWTSSGTSGHPGIFVQDAASLAAYEALDMLRLRGSPGALPLTAWPAGQRFAFVGATGGHFAGVTSVERLRRLVDRWGRASWPLPAVRTFSVLLPLPELARELQAFAPTVLISYPSCAAALAQRQLAGELSLRLTEVWVGGEQLSDGQRALVRQAWHCPLRNNYGASEFFSIAFECSHGGLHLNEDWVILEPVDRHGHAVPAGEVSDAVLLTNLANHVQPLLRYRLDDAVRFTGERCGCGCALPVIEVQGRSADTLVLHDRHDRAVTVLPLALETAIENRAAVAQFQLLCSAPDALELRLESAVRDDAAACARVRDALGEFLREHGLANVHVRFSREPPLRERSSGKLRRVRLWVGPPAPSR